MNSRAAQLHQQETIRGWTRRSSAGIDPRAQSVDSRISLFCLSTTLGICLYLMPRNFSCAFADVSSQLEESGGTTPPVASATSFAKILPPVLPIILGMSY